MIIIGGLIIKNEIYEIDLLNKKLMDLDPIQFNQNEQ